MLEYLKRQKETSAFFDDDGFGHTGDLGYYKVETDGVKIIYVDRMKELMK